jgi:hypothetical protein
MSSDWNVETLEWRRNAYLPTIHIDLSPRLDRQKKRSGLGIWNWFRLGRLLRFITPLRHHQLFCRDSVVETSWRALFDGGRNMGDLCCRLSAT